MKGTLSLRFITHSTVKAYYGVCLYIHVFLTTVIDRDVPLNTRSDSYFPSKQTPVRSEYDAWWECGDGEFGEGNVFFHI